MAAAIGTANYCGTKSFTVKDESTGAAVDWVTATVSGTLITITADPSAQTGTALTTPPIGTNREVLFLKLEVAPDVTYTSSIKTVSVPFMLTVFPACDCTQVRFNETVEVANLTTWAGEAAGHYKIDVRKPEFNKWAYDLNDATLACKDQTDYTQPY